MQLSAPKPTPRARINWILEEEMLGKREVVLKSLGKKNVRELGMVGVCWGGWREKVEGTEGGAFKAVGGGRRDSKK